MDISNSTFHQQNRDTFQYFESYSRSVFQLFTLFNRKFYTKSTCAEQSPILYAINLEQNHIEKISPHTKGVEDTKYANLILKEEYESKDLVNRFTGKRKTVYRLKSLDPIINRISCQEKKELAEAAIQDLNRRLSIENLKKNWLQNFLYY